MSGLFSGSGAAKAACFVAIMLVAGRAVSAQSGPAGSETPLQQAVRAAIQRAGPSDFSRTRASQPLAGDRWDAVRMLAPGTRATVHLQNATVLRGRFVGATADSVTLQLSSGERPLARVEISKVAVPDPNRRMVFGMLGVAAGAVAGLLACPYCANEGSPEITMTFVGVGAAAGALAFLTSPSRTVYETPAP